MDPWGYFKFSQAQAVFKNVTFPDKTCDRRREEGRDREEREERENKMKRMKKLPAKVEVATEPCWESGVQPGSQTPI